MLDYLKSCTFDLEGTIVDVESAHHDGHIYAARDVGVILSLNDCIQQLPHFIGGPDDEIAKEISVLAAQQGQRVDYRDVLASSKNHYTRLLQELPIAPRKGFLEFFSAIKDAGMKYAIGSLTTQEQAVVLLQRSGLINLFGYDNIVLREHVQKLKPAPDVWIETARRAQVKPEEQIVFEDSPRGIMGAVEVGAYCIGMPVYNRPEVIGALIDAGAKRIFLQWDEINPLCLLDNINQEKK